MLKLRRCHTKPSANLESLFRSKHMSDQATIRLVISLPLRLLNCFTLRQPKQELIQSLLILRPSVSRCLLNTAEDEITLQ